MPTYQEFRDAALAEGHSIDDVNKFILSKRSEAIASGYTESQIDSYLGIGNSDSKIKAEFNKNISAEKSKSPEKVMSVSDALEAGWQISVSGLASRGTLPNKIMSEDAPWYSRIASQLSTMAGDVPAMFAGAVVGGVGGTATGPGAAATAMGGAFAMPSGLRAVMIDAYKNGEFHTPEEFISRASGILIDTVKGYVTGAAAGAAGAVVGKAAAGVAETSVASGAISKGVATTSVETAKIGTELSTMVTIGKALEGELPSAQDFIDGAIVFAGVKASVSAAGKLHSIYKDVGVKPESVITDSVSSPSIIGDIASKNIEVPRAYKTPSMPEKAEIKPVEINESTPEGIVLSRISQSHPDKSGFTFNDFYRKFVDDLAPLEEISPESTKLFRLTRGAYGQASHFIDFGTFEAKTYKNNGEGLKQILDPVKDNMDGFRAYAVSKRSVELEGRGIKTGVPIEEAKSVIASGAEKYEPIFRKMVDYQDRLTQFLLDSEIISQSTYDSMRAANKEYVPFFRLMDDGAGVSTAGKGVSSRNPVKGIKGSEREIVDPIESVIKNTYLYISLATRNMAAKAFIDAPESSPYISNVKQKSSPIEVSSSEVKNFLREHGISEDHAESFSVFRPSKTFLGDNEISIFRNGKREIYEVPSDVATAIKATDAETINVAMKIMAVPARMLRAGAVLSPDFMLRNISRDQLSAFIFSKDNYIPMLDFAKGLFSIAKKDEYYQDWLKSGGANSAMVAIDRNYIQQHIFKLNEQTGFIDATWNVVKSPIEILRVASELMENATRVGEFKKAVKGESKSELQEAGYQSREITLDFARAGSQGRALNMISAFFNAQVQGVDRTVRAFKDDPYGSLFKVGLSITTPSVLLWLANHDDQRYKDLPDWQKNMFWIVMTEDTIYRIPKPFELGMIFGSGVERALDYMQSRDTESVKRLAKTVFEGFVPNMIPTAVSPALEQWANKSFFTGSPIVPHSKEKLLPELRYNDYTSEFTKSIASMLGKVPAVQDMSIASPAIIDNYIRAWTGGLGTYTVAIADKALREAGVLPDPVKPEKTLADIPAIKAFVVRNPSASTQPIIDFYENYNKTKMVFDSVQMMAKEGRVDAAVLLMESRPDAMMKLDGIKTALGHMSQSVHMINQMDVDAKDKGNKEKVEQLAKEKRQLIDTIYIQMTALARDGNETLKSLKR